MSHAILGLIGTAHHFARLSYPTAFGKDVQEYLDHDAILQLPINQEESSVLKAKGEGEMVHPRCYGEVDYGYTLINSVTLEEFTEDPFNCLLDLLNPEVFPVSTLEITVSPSYSEERNQAAHLFYELLCEMEEDFDKGIGHFGPFWFKDFKLVEGPLPIREHLPEAI